jgi:hypothetical protein
MHRVNWEIFISFFPIDFPFLVFLNSFAKLNQNVEIFKIILQISINFIYAH